MMTVESAEICMMIIGIVPAPGAWMRMHLIMTQTLRLMPTVCMILLLIQPSGSLCGMMSSILTISINQSGIMKSGDREWLTMSCRHIRTDLSIPILKTVALL